MTLPPPPRGWTAVAVLLAFVVVAFSTVLQIADTHPVDSYQACLRDGNPVTESQPPVCHDGRRHFVGPVATASSTPAPAGSVGYELLVNADSGGDYPRRQEIAQSPAEWQAYWQRIHAGAVSVPPIIPVDFTNSTVVAVSLGRHVTGGYSLRIGSIMAGPAGTSVEVIESSPGPGCVVTQVLTNPYLIVRSHSRLPEPVSFRISTNAREC